MTNAINHPHTDALELFLLNRLNGQKAEHVEEHLLVCEGCRTRAGAIQEEVELLQLAFA